MGVDHRSLDVFVTEEFLHGADIVTRFEQVGGKGVPEGMAAGWLIETSQLNGLLHRSLQIALVEVMTAGLARAWVGRKTIGRENTLRSASPIHGWP